MAVPKENDTSMADVDTRSALGLITILMGLAHFLVPRIFDPFNASVSPAALARSPTSTARSKQRSGSCCCARARVDHPPSYPLATSRI
ncbi:hypothetical protein [Mycobacterium sp. E3339]|uniref:hypothetical protein n=1 Tax=Mycobacterium sp. E3339 TaxID=1834146 RepID=UPI001E31D623|nr:hypothetical protein [Mycobacterium sp. E3339]